MQQDWWKTFFGDQIGDFMFGRISPRKTSAEVKTIIKNSKLPRESHILDLACGRGRHTVELARNKYRVTGLDYSKVYISTAKQLVKAQKLQDWVDLVRGDMRRLSPHFRPESFDMVVSLYNSFGYFSRKTDDRKMLREVGRVLRPSGLLVLNTLNHTGVEHRLCKLPTSADLPGIDRWEKLSNKEFFLDRARYDSRRREIRVDWHFLDLKAGKDRPYSFRQNVYSSEDLGKMLREAGFTIVKRWGRLDGGKFNSISWHQTILARKVK